MLIKKFKILLEILAATKRLRSQRRTLLFLALLFLPLLPGCSKDPGFGTFKSYNNFSNDNLPDSAKTGRELIIQSPVDSHPYVAPYTVAGDNDLFQQMTEDRGPLYSKELAESVQDVRFTQAEIPDDNQDSPTSPTPKMEAGWTANQKIEITLSKPPTSTPTNGTPTKSHPLSTNEVTSGDPTQESPVKTEIISFSTGPESSHLSGSSKSGSSNEIGPIPADDNKPYSLNITCQNAECDKQVLTLQQVQVDKSDATSNATKSSDSSGSSNSLERKAPAPPRADVPAPTPIAEVKILHTTVKAQVRVQRDRHSEKEDIRSLLWEKLHKENDLNNAIAKKESFAVDGGASVSHTSIAVNSQPLLEISTPNLDTAEAPIAKDVTVIPHDPKLGSISAVLSGNQPSDGSIIIDATINPASEPPTPAPKLRLIITPWTPENQTTPAPSERATPPNAANTPPETDTAASSVRENAPVDSSPESSDSGVPLANPGENKDIEDINVGLNFEKLLETAVIPPLSSEWNSEFFPPDMKSLSTAFVKRSHTKDPIVDRYIGNWLDTDNFSICSSSTGRRGNVSKQHLEEFFNNISSLSAKLTWALNRMNYPTQILYAGVIESNYFQSTSKDFLNPNIIGKAGDAGPFQVMPNTAKDIIARAQRETPSLSEVFGVPFQLKGLVQNKSNDHSKQTRATIVTIQDHDPRKYLFSSALMAGELAHYMYNLNPEAIQEDPGLIYFGYNGGQNYVSKFERDSRYTDFGVSLQTIAQFHMGLCPSIDYAYIVLAAQQIGMNPENYGMSVTPNPHLDIHSSSYFFPAGFKLNE